MSTISKLFEKNLHAVFLLSKQEPKKHDALLVEALRALAEVLVWGDQNDATLFDYFLEENILSCVQEICEKSDSKEVLLQFLQSINIIFENIRNVTSLYFLLSNNHVNAIILHDFDFQDEEVIAYYIYFLKTLSTKLDLNTINFFYNETLNDLPLYTQALRHCNHPESMIRIAVRTLTLNILSVKHSFVASFICHDERLNYFSLLITQLRESLLELDEYLLNHPASLSSSSHESLSSSKITSATQAPSHMQGVLSRLCDDLHYIDDILACEIQPLNEFITESFVKSLILPTHVSSISSYIRAHSFLLDSQNVHYQKSILSIVTSEPSLYHHITNILLFDQNTFRHHRSFTDASQEKAPKKANHSRHCLLNLLSLVMEQGSDSSRDVITSLLCSLFSAIMNHAHAVPHKNALILNFFSLIPSSVASGVSSPIISCSIVSLCVKCIASYIENNFQSYEGVLSSEQDRDALPFSAFTIHNCINILSSYVCAEIDYNACKCLPYFSIILPTVYLLYKKFLSLLSLCLHHAKASPPLLASFIDIFECQFVKVILSRTTQFCIDSKFIVENFQYFFMPLSSSCDHLNSEFNTLMDHNNDESLSSSERGKIKLYQNMRIFFLLHKLLKMHFLPNRCQMNTLEKRFSSYAKTCTQPLLESTINLSNKHIISCNSFSFTNNISKKSFSKAYFLFLSNFHVVLVEPHSVTLGAGVIKHALPLKDIQVTGTSSFKANNTVLHIKLKANSFSWTKDGTLHSIYLKSQSAFQNLSFQDGVSCHAVRHEIGRAVHKSSLIKLRVIEKILCLRRQPKTSTPKPSLSSSSASLSKQTPDASNENKETHSFSCSHSRPYFMVTNTLHPPFAWGQGRNYSDSCIFLHCNHSSS